MTYGDEFEAWGLGNKPERLAASSVNRQAGGSARCTNKALQAHPASPFHSQGSQVPRSTFCGSAVSMKSGPPPRKPPVHLCSSPHLSPGCCCPGAGSPTSCPVRTLLSRGPCSLWFADPIFCSHPLPGSICCSSCVAFADVPLAASLLPAEEPLVSWSIPEHLLECPRRRPYLGAFPAQLGKARTEFF